MNKIEESKQKLEYIWYNYHTKKNILNQISTNTNLYSQIQHDIIDFQAQPSYSIISPMSVPSSPVVNKNSCQISAQNPLPTISPSFNLPCPKYFIKNDIIQKSQTRLKNKENLQIRNSQADMRGYCQPFVSRDKLYSSIASIGQKFTKAQLIKISQPTHNSEITHNSESQHKVQRTCAVTKLPRIFNQQKHKESQLSKELELMELLKRRNEYTALKLKRKNTYKRLKSNMVIMEALNHLMQKRQTLLSNDDFMQMTFIKKIV